MFIQKNKEPETTSVSIFIFFVSQYFGRNIVRGKCAAPNIRYLWQYWMASRKIFTSIRLVDSNIINVCAENKNVTKRDKWRLCALHEIYSEVLCTYRNVLYIMVWSNAMRFYRYNKMLCWYTDKNMYIVSMQWYPTNCFFFFSLFR